MSKKLLAVALSLGLVAGALAAPATAKKKKAKAAPVTLYLHGQTAIGENDSFTAVADAFLPMDAEKPTDSTPKSRIITNYLVGPNWNCAGNTLFPVWTGPISGRITGDVKVTLHTLSTPGPIDIRIWPDVNSQMCTSTIPVSPSDAYPDSLGEVTVEVPAGHGEVTAVIKGVDFTAQSSLMMQISPHIAVDVPDPGGSILHPLIGRILYDTPDLASSIQLMCTPTSGSSCI